MPAHTPIPGEHPATSASATAEQAPTVPAAGSAGSAGSAGPPGPIDGDKATPGVAKAGAHRKSSTAVLSILVVLAVFIGVALRAWYMSHMSLTADEAIDGLIARDALHGHFVAFYWGQQYGGAEPYLTAVLFAALGQAAWVVRLTAVLLSGASALLLWRIAKRLVGDNLLALLAAATFWCLSVAAVDDATIEWGFRGVTMVCGLGAVLCALRLLEARRLSDAAGLGASLGLGWWASPEIVYFVVPVAVLLVVAVIRSDRGSRLRSWTGPATVAAGFAVAGALPWIWSNVRSHLASLRRGSFTVPPGTSFQGNLKAFAHHALAIELGLQRPVTGAWLFGNGHHGIGRVALVVVVLAVVAALAVSLVVCLRRGWESRAIALGVLAFPVLYAASPATWYWADGRYVVFIGPLLVLTLAVGASALGEARRRPARRQVGSRRTTGLARGSMAVVLVGFVALCLVGFHLSTNATPSTFTQGWGDPDGGAQATADKLVSHGVLTGYADYWVAYKLDLLGHDKLVITTAGGDTDRSRRLDDVVRGSRSAAWLFVNPAAKGEALSQFGQTPLLIGPGGMSQSQFQEILSNMHIGYRVVQSGLLTAVIPDRPVTPEEVGL